MEEQAGLWGLTSQRRMHSSSSSTPYESAVCSPRSSTDRAPSSFYSVSAPTYPLTITCDIRSLPATGMGFVAPSSDGSFCDEQSSEEFDFSARFSETDPPWSPTPMSSADELFYNGQIRPLWYNSEDLIHLSSHSASKANDDEDDDEESCFDFRSSADYKFSMFSAVHTPGFVMDKLQRFSGCSYNRPPLDGYSVHSHGEGRKGGVQDAGEAQQLRSFARQGLDEMIAKQAFLVKVEESRGRRAGGYKEGGIRRARSLSPLRVFHMDDEVPRQSFETCRNEQEEEQGTQMARSKGRRLTLKELLHSGSRTERTSNQNEGEKLQNKAYTEVQMSKKTKERSTLCVKASTKQQASDNKCKGCNQASLHLPSHHQASMSAHGSHYASHTDQIRQQTFLPYRHGLLGCLGLTSKSYHTAAGIRNFHSKSRGTRQSSGYDSAKS